jgi:hypothetical protein
MSNDLELTQKTYELEVTKAQDAYHLEIARNLLDEWKWRHQHCWKSLQRYSLSGLTIALIPYAWMLRELANIQPGAASFKTTLGEWVIIFPPAALLLTQTGIWMFASEYARCRPVEAMYNKVLGDYNPNPQMVGTASKYRFGVGPTSILIYGLFFTALSLVNLWALTKAASIPVGRNLWLASFIVASLVAAFDVIFIFWGKEQRAH